MVASMQYLGYWGGKHNLVLIYISKVPDDTCAKRFIPVVFAKVILFV